MQDSAVDDQCLRCTVLLPSRLVCRYAGENFRFFFARFAVVFVTVVGVI